MSSSPTMAALGLDVVVIGSRWHAGLPVNVGRMAFAGPAASDLLSGAAATGRPASEIRLAAARRYDG
jgi:hypothetical protein